MSKRLGGLNDLLKVTQQVRTRIRHRDPSTPVSHYPLPTQTGHCINESEAAAHVTTRFNCSASGVCVSVSVSALQTSADFCVKCSHSHAQVHIQVATMSCLKESIFNIFLSSAIMIKEEMPVDISTWEKGKAISKYFL